MSINNRFHRGGNFLIALDGNTPRLLQCDENGNLVTSNNTVSNGIPKQIYSEFTAEQVEATEHILPSPPIGKSWLIYSVECSSAENVNLYNFSLNNESMGLYITGTFGNYNLYEKFGGAVSVKSSDKLSIFYTNNSDADHKIGISFYIREINN